MDYTKGQKLKFTEIGLREFPGRAVTVEVASLWRFEFVADCKNGIIRVLRHGENNKPGFWYFPESFLEAVCSKSPS